MAIDDALAPPASEEAEMAVLGSCLLEPSLVLNLGGLKPEDFYLPKHRRLWTVMLGLAASGKPSDALVVFREVERAGLLEETGGREYIATLASAVTSPAHADHFADIVKEKAGLRGLLALARKIEAAVAGGCGYADGLKTAHDALFDAGQRQGGREGRPISEAMYEVLGALQGKRDPQRVCPTGLFALDDFLAGGLHAGELAVVAGRPGSGKTSLALNVASFAALNGASVLIFSLEMTAESLANSMLSSRSGVSGDRMRKGPQYLGAEAMEKIVDTANLLGNTKIVVNDDSAASIGTIRREAQGMKARMGLDLLVVDYLQLMDSPASSRGRVEDVGAISRGLKILSKDLDVPVVALSQLNRDPEKREGGRPILADLRESGSIEQDCDVALLIHRPWMRTKNPLDQNVAEIIVAKNRHGPTDTVKVGFVGECLLFRNLTRADQGA